MPEQVVYKDIPYHNEGLDAGPKVGASFWNPFLTPEITSRSSVLSGALSLNMLDRLSNTFQDIRKERLEEERELHQKRIMVDKILKGEVELIDITNFMKAYNRFMQTAYDIQRLVIKHVNKTFNRKIPFLDYKEIVPEKVLFPNDEKLRDFERYMKANVDQAFKKLLPLFDPIQLRTVNIDAVLKNRTN